MRTTARRAGAPRCALPLVPLRRPGLALTAARSTRSEPPQGRGGVETRPGSRPSR
jgi:hypothetical protein